MPEHTSEELLAVFDRCRLHGRYWTIFGLVSAVAALDFFDFFSVGFLVAKIAPDWHLTYGQSATILFGGGVGAVVGALVWGALSDKWGRKALIVSGTFICAFGAGAISLIPDGAWSLFAVLRFLVGFGLAGSFAPATTLIVEITPTRHRTIVTGLFVVAPTVGTMIASLTVANLFAQLGWRGVAALGVIPALFGVLAIFMIPESVRWLAAKGRFAEAQKTVAGLLRLPLSAVPLPTTKPTVPPTASLAELYARPGIFWLTLITWGAVSTAAYGVFLWGPTIVAQLLDMPVQQAAQFFFYVTVAGVIGKVAFSFMAPWLGRRRCGELQGYGMFVCLAAAAYFHSTIFAGISLFVVLLIVNDLFMEGGYSNLAPYSPEVFGVRMGARASGLGQAANGGGKILGPLSLALIAGTGNVVAPQATMDAVFPAFMFLAACGLAAGLAFTFLAPETHGRPIPQDADEMPAAPRVVAGSRTAAR
jgi:putative MFS transporter